MFTIYLALGSTLFIEPLEVFDLNNQINSLIIEENIEIEKFLDSLSKLLSPITNELRTNIHTIETLDFIFAKAKYSKYLNANEPIFNNKKFVNLINARHPLIDQNKVVPISINLGDDFNTIVITGPNTGGKTVCLKTLGLLCAMAQSGLHIPASNNSTLPVFDNIYADIGDEQSISESLSTFSSHMINIVEITNTATSSSLVLLDELGSGTDPVYGSKLAISILEYLYDLKTLCLVTTHYQELKNFALTTPGFKNASFEFDIETLSPTYKLLIGIPGKSNAFEISKKLGLNDKILDRAIALTDSNDISIEELLKGIYDNKLQVEKEKEETSKNLVQVEMLRKKLEKDYSDVELKASKIVNDAKMEARDILFSAKDEATTIIKKANSIYENLNQDSIKDLNNMRNTLNDDIKKLSVASSHSSGNLTDEDIKIGMEVYVISLNKTGTVLSVPNSSSEVLVQVGSIKTNVKINNLLKADNNVKTNPTTSKSSVSTKAMKKSSKISSEINVIGYTVEDAIYVIDKYLDDAKLAKLETVRIIHGKGTGKLRAGIHSFLKSHSHVKDFRIGGFGEGEMGATVVTLS